MGAGGGACRPALVGSARARAAAGDVRGGSPAGRPARAAALQSLPAYTVDQACPRPRGGQARGACPKARLRRTPRLWVQAQAACCAGEAQGYAAGRGGAGRRLGSTGCEGWQRSSTGGGWRRRGRGGREHRHLVSSAACGAAPGRLPSQARPRRHTSPLCLPGNPSLKRMELRRSGEI